jgi:hypothetical protein
MANLVQVMGGVLVQGDAWRRSFTEPATSTLDLLDVADLVWLDTRQRLLFGWIPSNARRAKEFRKFALPRLCNNDH